MSHRIHISHPGHVALAVTAAILALIVGAAIGATMRSGMEPKPGTGPHLPDIITRVQAVSYVPERSSQFVVPERHSQFGVADNLSPLHPEPLTLNGVVPMVATDPMTGGLPDYAVEGWHALPAANPLGYQPISGGVPTYAIDTYEPISGGLPDYAKRTYEPIGGGLPVYAE
ncbi:hypothetical protein [Demequina phytophila]|uniref:hypothetical protein n=1 Tax=Demequina phytophila TaxID=1638981 RepID=UPI000781876B|nr:hypothetical protein [Demequina phytophila]